MAVKFCSNCKEIKDVSSFGKNKSTKDGLQHWCNTCRSFRAKTAYKPKSLDDPDRLCVNCGSGIPFERRQDARCCSVKCGKSYNRKKHYYNNLARYEEKRLEYNSDIERKCLVRLKSRCKITGQDFNLEVGDLTFPTHCPVLGLELKYDNKGKGYKPDGYSVDKINPSLGYVKGNVRVISSRANLLKSNATVEELEKVLKDAKQWQCST